jgi:putative ABC transport system permease protein
MWGNYLTVAFRSLVKDRTFAFINILGLALGLAACLLLLLYVRYELSYDRWLPDADRVFQVQTFGVHPETGEKMSQQGVTRPVSEALAKHFPQIESVAKLETDPIIVVKNGQALKVDQAAAADGSLFNILQVPFLEGDARPPFATPTASR